MLCRNALTFALALAATVAQADCTEDAMIVFDGSGSMAEVGFNLFDQPRIFEAREAVREALPQVAPGRRIGLIVYGPGTGDACTGIDLRFAPRANAADAVIGDVDALLPEGETALTDAVALAARTLDHTARPGTVVLITDGKETCGGQPCALATELARDSLALTVHVIGFKVRGDHFAWEEREETGYEAAVSVAKCLATQTGGTYASAETVNELVKAMNRTLGCDLLF